MSKFAEAMETYKSDFTDKMGLGELDEALLEKVAKGLGPSIYNADSSMVSCSDQTEKDRVKANFLLKKMELTDSAELDAAITATCEEMGSSNRSKHRAIFYYLLVKKLGLEGKYA
jgi:Protein of unknown function (DUF2853)